jgi:hypothetical protein
LAEILKSRTTEKWRANKMSRPVTIPNIFVGESGLQPASQIDTNFANLKNVINDSASGFVNFATDVGGANNYVVTLTPPPSGYVAGFTIVMLPANTNTGAPTIAVNSLGSVAIVRTDGTAVQAGDIVAGTAIAMTYNGTSFVALIRLNSIVTPTTSGLFPGIYAARTWIEDFSTLLPSTTSSGTLIGGQLGWLSVLSGTNTTIGNSTNGIDAFNQCDGVWGVSTGSTSSGIAGAVLNTMPPALGALDLYYRIAFSSVPTAAQNAVHRVGITDNVPLLRMLSFLM